MATTTIHTQKTQTKTKTQTVFLKPSAAPPASTLHGTSSASSSRSETPCLDIFEIAAYLECDKVPVVAVRARRTCEEVAGICGSIAARASNVDCFLTADGTDIMVPMPIMGPAWTEAAASVREHERAEIIAKKVKEVVDGVRSVAIAVLSAESLQIIARRAPEFACTKCKRVFNVKLNAVRCADSHPSGKGTRVLVDRTKLVEFWDALDERQRIDIMRMLLFMEGGHPDPRMLDPIGRGILEADGETLMRALEKASEDTCHLRTSVWFMPLKDARTGRDVAAKCAHKIVRALWAAFDAHVLDAAFEQEDKTERNRQKRTKKKAKDRKDKLLSRLVADDGFFKNFMRLPSTWADAED